MKIPFKQEVKMGRYSIDFLILNKIALEIDGEYWHRNQKDRDSRKNQVIQNANYILIRIRADNWNDHVKMNLLNELTKNMCQLLMKKS